MSVIAVSIGVAYILVGRGVKPGTEDIESTNLGQQAMDTKRRCYEARGG